jgi:SAM-dependent methyltransferase
MTAGHPDHGHKHHQDAGGEADAVFGEAFWDERYRSSAAVWSGRPNPHLVSEAAGLVPGAALDVGCGEGADAIWLAGKGWQVTAVDISAVALARGAASAVAAGGEIAQRITWLHADLIAADLTGVDVTGADLTTWVPAAARYDLVSAQFMHLAPGPRDWVFGRLADSVAPGGCLLIVGHHPSDLQTTVMRPAPPELFFTGDDVAALLAPGEWKIVVNEARAHDVADPEGRSVTVHDTVLRAERRV